MATSDSDSDSSLEPFLLHPRPSKACTNLLACVDADSKPIEQYDSDDEIFHLGNKYCPGYPDYSSESSSVVAALNLEPSQHSMFSIKREINTPSAKHHADSVDETSSRKNTGSGLDMQDNSPLSIILPAGEAMNSTAADSKLSSSDSKESESDHKTVLSQGTPDIIKNKCFSASQKKGKSHPPTFVSMKIKQRRYSIGAKPLSKPPHVSFAKTVKISDTDDSMSSLSEEDSELEKESNDMSETPIAPRTNTLCSIEEYQPLNSHSKFENGSKERDCSQQLDAGSTLLHSNEKKSNKYLLNSRSDSDGALIVCSLSAADDTQRPPSPKPILTQSKSDDSSTHLPEFERKSSEPDLINDSSKGTEGSLSEIRSLRVEKELVESKVRMLQFKICQLQAEEAAANKKLNKVLDDNISLKMNVDALRSENEILKCSLEKDTLKIHEQHKKRVTELENKIKQLTKNLRAAESEIDSLQKQLAHAGKAIDHNKLLRDELDKAREKLRELKACHTKDTEKLTKASAEIRKLTKENSILKEQLAKAVVENKQASSIEQRLKIVEYRLQQEHADRASKLSDVEARLVTENAKLQDFKNECDMLKMKVERFREALKDVSQERDELQKQLTKEIATLTEEKHKALAKAKLADDIKTALSAENEHLRMILSTARADNISEQLFSLSKELEDCKHQLEIKTFELQCEREKVAIAKSNLRTNPPKGATWKPVSSISHSDGETNTSVNECGFMRKGVQVSTSPLASDRHFSVSNKHDAQKSRAAYYQLEKVADSDLEEMTAELNRNKEMIEANYREINILMDALNGQSQEIIWIRKCIDDLVEQSRKWHSTMDILQKDLYGKLATICDSKSKEVVYNEHIKLKAEYDKIERILQMQSAELEKEKASLRDSQLAIDAMRRIKETQEKINRQLEETVNGLRNKIIEETKSKAKYQQETVTLQAELVRVKKELTILEEELRILQRNIKEKEADLLVHKKQNKELKKQLSKLTDLIKKKEVYLTGLEITNVRQQDEINQLSSQMEMEQRYFNDRIKELECKLTNKCGNDCSQTEALMLQRERLLSRDLQFAQQQLIAKDKLIMNLEEQNFSLHEQLKKVIQRAQLAQDAYNITDKRHEHYERRDDDYVEKNLKMHTNLKRERGEVSTSTAEVKEDVRTRVIPVRYTDFESRVLLNNIADKLKNQVFELEQS